MFWIPVYQPRLVCSQGKVTLEITPVIGTGSISRLDFQVFGLPHTDGLYSWKNHPRITTHTAPNAYRVVIFWNSVYHTRTLYIRGKSTLESASVRHRIHRVKIGFPPTAGLFPEARSSSIAGLGRRISSNRIRHRQSCQALVLRRRVYPMSGYVARIEPEQG